MSTRQSRLDKKDNRKSPKNDDGESVDELLANVDQFIEGVYRDLSISPPRPSTMVNVTTSNVRRSISNDRFSTPPTSSPARLASLQSPNTRTAETPVRSPVTRRNMDAEIDRINRICDNVDQNLRSVGVIMNASTPTNRCENRTIQINSPATSSTSIIIVNNTSPVFPSMFRRMKLQADPMSSASSSRETASEIVVDLSNSQAETPETFRRPVTTPHNNFDDDDDVILVSADIPSVVNLCTPNAYEEIPRSRHIINHDNLNRRRLHQNNDEENSSCAGPSSSKRRSQPSYTGLENSSSSARETVSETTDNDRTPFMCAVCMESCLQRQPTSTICGHVFCKLCIEQAITLTHKCPLCNKKLSRKHTFRIYF